MTWRTASSLLRAPVHVRGIRLGEVETVLLNADATRILGFDVLCGDGINRFLPFSASRLNGDRIAIDSTLTLLDARQLDFYRSRGRTLASVPERANAVVGEDGALVVPLSARC